MMLVLFHFLLQQRRKLRVRVRVNLHRIGSHNHSMKIIGVAIGRRVCGGWLVRILHQYLAVHIIPSSRLRSE
jgi:hypothetical protein